MTTTTENTSTYAALNEAGRLTLLRTARDAMRRAGRAYLDWRMRRASVRILRSLDDRVLKDIGISRSEILSVVCGEQDDRRRRYERTWE